LSISRFLGAAAIAAALVTPAVASAQQSPPAPAATYAPGVPGAPGAHRGHRRGGFRKALRGLNLSASQQSQIDQAFTQSRAANQNADPATRKANRQQLRAKIEAILTPAQRAQLQANLKQNRRG
jgi:Spy/CpxP family protein refolding chaperone